MRPYAHIYARYTRIRARTHTCMRTARKGRLHPIGNVVIAAQSTDNQLPFCCVDTATFHLCDSTRDDLSAAPHTTITTHRHGQYSPVGSTHTHPKLQRSSPPTTVLFALVTTTRPPLIDRARKTSFRLTNPFGNTSIKHQKEPKTTPPQARTGFTCHPSNTPDPSLHVTDLGV